MSDDRHDAVSRRAYELWQQEGGDHGRHEDHWQRASREIDEAAPMGAPDGTTLAVAPSETDLADPEPAKSPRKRASAQPAAPQPASTAAAKPRKPRAK